MGYTKVAHGTVVFRKRWEREDKRLYSQSDYDRASVTMVAKAFHEKETSLTFVGRAS